MVRRTGTKQCYKIICIMLISLAFLYQCNKAWRKISAQKKKKIAYSNKEDTRDFVYNEEISSEERNLETPTRKYFILSCPKKTFARFIIINLML